MNRLALLTLLSASLLNSGCGTKTQSSSGDQAAAPAAAPPSVPASSPAPPPENPPPTPPSPIPDATSSLERKAAEWALAQGGSVVLASGAKVSALSELPAGSFQLVEIALKDSGHEKPVVGLENIRGLSRLQRLILRGNPVSTEELASLRELKSLEMLNLHNTAATDAGLEHLKAWLVSCISILAITARLLTLARRI